MEEPALQDYDRASRRLIGMVIAFAAVGVIALAAITYAALSANSGQSAVQPPIQQPSSEKADAKPAAVVAADAKSDNGKQINGEALDGYSKSIQPLIEQMRLEMEGVKIDLRQFIKTANKTEATHQIRRVIDGFRDQLKDREKRLSSLSDSFKSLAPPTELEPHHKRLSAGAGKYSIAVQSYIRGLSAYSFNQISASQADLEAADIEIRSAADQFQQALAQMAKEIQ